MEGFAPDWETNNNNFCLSTQLKVTLVRKADPGPFILVVQLQRNKVREGDSDVKSGPGELLSELLRIGNLQKRCKMSEE